MTVLRRSFVAVLAAAMLVMTSALVFAAPKPWNEKAFQAAQAAGKPILVDVYANW